VKSISRDIIAFLEKKFDNGSASLYNCVAKSLTNVISRDIIAVLEKNFDKKQS
jgi:hypothetical protein